jgi:ribonuclease HI
MRTRGPHYLLFTGAIGSDANAAHWRFVLQPVGSDVSLAVADVEEFARPSRLELLAVVRGLEALEQPSRVTLLTDSRYVIRGLRRGLNQWRERRWRWERFGRLVPIRDADLWRRVDRAMQFHDVDCSEWYDDEQQPPTDEWNGQSVADDSRGECLGDDPPEQPALVIVARAKRKISRKTRGGSWTAALDRLRQAVLAQIMTIRGPEFTQAA